MHQQSVQGGKPLLSPLLHMVREAVLIGSLQGLRLLHTHRDTDTNTDTHRDTDTDTHTHRDTHTHTHTHTETTACKTSEI